MHRRAFLKSVSAATVILSYPTFGRAALNPRIALNKFVLDPAKVAALKKGVAVMKSRKPSDPTSWFFQAAIHGVSSDLISAALVTDPAVAQVDQKKYWNQCTHFGNASSADFLIWHRGYVYYFERILRAASGEPSLTLPYWDYSDPNQRGCPKIFADADPDPTSTTLEARNPLYDARREQAWVNGLYELTDKAVSTSDAFAKYTYFSSSSASAFGGNYQDLEPDSEGALERSPHNLIHFAIGGVISTAAGVVSDNSAAGLMADPTTSAFDPIFWVHHSNIDRLWNVWGCRANSSWGNPPPDTWLNGTPWWFYDFDGTSQNLSRRSYIDSRALGISFDDENPSCAPVSSQPLPKQPAVVSILDVKRPIQEQVANNMNALLLSSSAEVETTVPISSETAKSNALDVTVADRIFLELVDVGYAGPPSVGFTIYVRLDDNPQRVELGTLNLFGLRHGDHVHHAAQGQRFDITELIKRSSTAVRVLHLSVQPFDLLVSKKGAAPLQRSGGVQIGGFRIVTERGNSLPRQ